jgi:hypothetical protein
MHSYRAGGEQWWRFLGVHSASHGPMEPIAIRFVDAKHPVSRGFGDWTTTKEELYNNVKIFESATPLARGRQRVQRPDGTQNEEDFVVAWTNDYDGTRVFSTTIGHSDETVRDPRYLDFVARGLLWAAGRSQTAAVAAEPIVPKETIRLFDGHDLSRFSTWLVDLADKDPDGVFSVVDKIDGAPAVRISGQRWGALISKDRYRNYRLVTELRWGAATWGARKTKARDSGVLVHAQGQPGNTGADFNGPWMRSIEAQVIEGGIGDIIMVGGYATDGRFEKVALSAHARRTAARQNVYDPAAPLAVFDQGRVNWYGRDPAWKDVLGFRGHEDVESAGGKWTRLEVVCDGDKITNIVNGRVVNAAQGAELREGHILLQSEGAEIFFRKVELHPLDGQ